MQGLVRAGGVPRVTQGCEGKLGLELSGRHCAVQAAPVHLKSASGLQGGPPWALWGRRAGGNGGWASWLSCAHLNLSGLLSPGWRAAVPRSQCQEEDPPGQASGGLWVVGWDTASILSQLPVCSLPLGTCLSLELPLGWVFTSGQSLVLAS